MSACLMMIEGLKCWLFDGHDGDFQTKDCGACGIAAERGKGNTHRTGRRLIWVTNVYIPDGDSLYRLESLIRTLRWLVNASLVSDP